MIQDAIDAIALGSLYALFALGIARDLRDHAADQLRARRADHGRRVRARADRAARAGLLIPLTLAVVVAVALAMERVAFRPCAAPTPATLLITSFAVSYLLQNLPR